MNFYNENITPSQYYLRAALVLCIQTAMNIYKYSRWNNILYLLIRND